MSCILHEELVAKLARHVETQTQQCLLIMLKKRKPAGWTLECACYSPMRRTWWEVLIKEFNKVSATRNECRDNGQNMDFRWVHQRVREDLALNSDSVKWKHVWPGPFSGHVHSRIKVRAHTHRCAGGKDRLISWRKKGGNNNVEMCCLRFSQIIAFYLKRWNIHVISAYYMLISLTDNKTKYRDTALKASERMKFRFWGEKKLDLAVYLGFTNGDPLLKMLLFLCSCK